MYNTKSKFNNRLNDLTLRNTYPNDIITIEPQKKRLSSKCMAITDITIKCKK